VHGGGSPFWPASRKENHDLGHTSLRTGRRPKPRESAIRGSPSRDRWNETGQALALGGGAWRGFNRLDITPPPAEPRGLIGVLMTMWMKQVPADHVREERPCIPSAKAGIPGPPIFYEGVRPARRAGSTVISGNEPFIVRMAWSFLRGRALHSWRASPLMRDQHNAKPRQHRAERGPGPCRFMDRMMRIPIRVRENGCAGGAAACSRKPKGTRTGGRILRQETPSTVPTPADELKALHEEVGETRSPGAGCGPAGRRSTEQLIRSRPSPADGPTRTGEHKQGHGHHRVGNVANPCQPIESQDVDSMPSVAAADFGAGRGTSGGKFSRSEPGPRRAGQRASGSPPSPPPRTLSPRGGRREISSWSR